MQNKLSKNIIFIKSFTPYDFKKNMGNLAVEIKYTDGDTDMLTTPMPPERGNDKGDFKDEAEYYEFIKWLESNNIPKA